MDMARKKKRLSRRDKRDLKIIEARKNQPTRPYEEVAKELEELDKADIKKKMLSVIKKKGSMHADQLWRETWKAFGLTIDDIATEKWIPEIELRRCIVDLLSERKLFLLGDMKLSLHEPRHRR
jgi:hypothetical protein